MRRTCCTSPRRGWLLPLLVTSLVFGGAVGRPSGEPAVCGRSCCSVLPSCRTARTVDCNCPGHDTMVFQSGDFPVTASTVTIRDTDHVIVEEDAIENLHALFRFSVSNIKQLELRHGGMTLHSQNSLRSASFENIGSLHVAPKAFSGFWLPQTTIRMGRVVELHVETGAFDIHIDGTGPSISLDTVQDLKLEARGLSAQFSTIDMLHVNMDVCHEGNFGHHSPHTRWKNVVIREAREGCYRGLNDSAHFDISGLELTNMSTGAISGTAHALAIRDSHISDLQERAFDITVGKVTMSSSHFDTLHPLSISVRATGQAHLEYLRIKELQKRALRGVRLVRSPRWAPPMLHLNQIEIITAEDGSLTLSSSTDRKLIASYISVKSRATPICPIEKYARVLAGVGPAETLPAAQRTLSSALSGNTLCDEPDLKMTPGDLDKPDMGVAADLMTEDDEMESSRHRITGAGNAPQFTDDKTMRFSLKPDVDEDPNPHINVGVREESHDTDDGHGSAEKRPETSRLASAASSSVSRHHSVHYVLMFVTACAAILAGSRVFC